MTVYERFGNVNYDTRNASLASQYSTLFFLICTKLFHVDESTVRTRMRKNAENVYNITTSDLNITYNAETQEISVSEMTHRYEFGEEVRERIYYDPSYVIYYAWSDDSYIMSLTDDLETLHNWD